MIDELVIAEKEIRPKKFEDFVGQETTLANLKTFIKASKIRETPLDHVLLQGPPGLGKTTIAQIIAEELKRNIKITSAPTILKTGDLAAILTSLEDGDVLFIDEIHRLPMQIEEILYSAMEDFVLDLMIGEGPTARSVRINLAKFTLVGATTRSGMLSKPLLDRFGIPLRLEFYKVDELCKIVKRNAEIFNVRATDDGAYEIAKRSRGTPRIAGRLLRRVADFAAVLDNEIDKKTAETALQKMEVDERGLDSQDVKYLSIIASNFKGGPVGAETISAALSEPREAIEEVIEPYLIQTGLLKRTSRGRMLTSEAFRHLRMEPPAHLETPQTTMRF